LCAAFWFRPGKTELKVARISRVAAREWHCLEFPDASVRLTKKQQQEQAAKAAAAATDAAPSAQAASA
jgi:hypothetical protein